jgi:superoxide dismutase, Fe-Mn family
MEIANEEASMITTEKTKKNLIVKYDAKSYDHLFGIEGFTDKLLANHFKLYHAYVDNTNAALKKLEAYSKEGKEKATEMSEIRRRLGWEFNGMRLHEYYFDNLGGEQPIRPESDLAHALSSQFGDFESWKKDFIATGAMRGIGWAILYKDPQTDRLFNSWIDEHNTGHLAGGTPLLVMDVFEHAFVLDYGTDKAKYINAFFKNINWNVVTTRWEND